MNFAGSFPRSPQIRCRTVALHQILVNISAQLVRKHTLASTGRAGRDSALRGLGVRVEGIGFRVKGRYRYRVSG